MPQQDTPARQARSVRSGDLERPRPARQGQHAGFSRISPRSLRRSAEARPAGRPQDGRPPTRVGSRWRLETETRHDTPPPRWRLVPQEAGMLATGWQNSPVSHNAPSPASFNLRAPLKRRVRCVRMPSAPGDRRIRVGRRLSCGATVKARIFARFPIHLRMTRSGKRRDRLQRRRGMPCGARA